MQLSRTDAGAIYVFDEERQEFKLRATYGMSEEMIVAITDRRIGIGDAHIGPAATQRKPIQVPDMRDEPPSPVNEINLREGYRALLIMPLLRPDQHRRRAGGAAQDAGRVPASPPSTCWRPSPTSRWWRSRTRSLFNEIEEKGKQLAVASQHKSQFLANMSHELRTPLNAILGYTELILDGIYGEAPEKAQGVLKRVESNGQHLLGLINDVLDLSKIEAGQLTLSLTDYSMKDVLYNVFSAVEPLANDKKLGFKVEAPPDMPKGHGDERRLTQVMLNLVGNAIKFTDTGDVVDQGERHQRLVHGRRAGHRPRHLPGRSGQDFRGVPAGRQFRHQEEGRHRASASRSRGASSRCTAASCGSSPRSARARCSRSRCRSRSQAQAKQ